MARSSSPSTSTAAVPLDAGEVERLALDALDELKGVDVTVIDIRNRTSIADSMVISTGTSQRHVRSLAENVRTSLKRANHPPLGVEGDDKSDWILVDLGDVIVHVMTDEKREFYALEKLWSVGADDELEAAPPPALHSV